MNQVNLHDHFFQRDISARLLRFLCSNNMQQQLSVFVRQRNTPEHRLFSSVVKFTRELTQITPPCAADSLLNLFATPEALWEISR
jgi:hypothetical protein